MSCEIKRFPKVKICIGDLRHKIQLATRVLGGQEPGDFDDTGVTITPYASPWAAVRTVEGTRRFAGVNISDEATHLFYIRHRTDWLNIEAGNTFVIYGGRNFRVLRATNNDEDSIFDIIQTTERGDDEASEA